jgi:iron(III) transport system ATP-binding protein
VIDMAPTDRAAEEPNDAAEASANALIEVRALVKRYEGRHVTANAVDAISFDVRDGQLVTLLGPSGCGKTTTLRMLAGLERPTDGEIRIDGQLMYSASQHVLVPANRRPVGMVFQSYAIWPHMTVFENVSYPLRVARRKPPKAAIRERTEAALEAVGLADYAKRPGTALSGGQQQRAALARALVKEPRVLLLDEPLSNLDAKLRDRMREWLRETQERIGVTTVYVTHDQDEALALSDVILLMDGGHVVEAGDAQQIYRRPRSAFAAGFVGVSTRLDGVVEAVEADGAVRVATAQGALACEACEQLAVGDAVAVFLRPEDLTLSARPSDGAWAGTVKLGLFQGACWDFYVTVADTDVRVTVHDLEPGFQTGDPVYVRADSRRLIVVKTPGS